MDEGGLDLARLHVAVFARSEATRQSRLLRCHPEQGEGSIHCERLLINLSLRTSFVKQSKLLADRTV